MRTIWVFMLLTLSPSLFTVHLLVVDGGSAGYRRNKPDMVGFGQTKTVPTHWYTLSLFLSQYAVTDERLGLVCDAQRFQHTNQRACVWSEKRLHGSRKHKELSRLHLAVTTR